MVVEVLAADTIAVGTRIVSPAEGPGIRDVVRKEVAEPVDAVRRRPSLVSVSVQPMDGDNTGSVRASSATHRASLLDNGAISLCHNLEALRACLERRFCRIGRVVGLIQDSAY